jgi:hypothetical protein
VLLDIIRVALGPEAMNVVLFVERKMEINRQRPRLYGVKGASCQEEKAK